MKLRKGFKSVLVMIMTLLCMFVMPVMSASADTAGANADLNTWIKNAGGTSAQGNEQSHSGVYKLYEREGGGQFAYSEIVDDTGLVNANFTYLKSSAQEELLTDMNTYADLAIQSDIKDGGKNKITEDTKTTWLQNLQQCNGVGSQLMNTILQNTKPDYATANRIYEPFSGVVGTALGLGAILIMAFLGVTMVLDLSYIGIPAFRLMLNGDGENGKGKPKVISYEAVSAVEAAEGGAGGGGQNGSTNKVAVGLYFKKRVIMLVILGICLLYLIQGQIFTLVSWILDLVSGFLGF